MAHHVEALRFLSSSPLRDSLDRAAHDAEFAAVVLSVVLIPAALILLACVFIASNWGDDVGESPAAGGGVRRSDGDGDGGDGDGGGGAAPARGKRKTA